jgi:hypothetical protein
MHPGCTPPGPSGSPRGGATWPGRLSRTPRTCNAAPMHAPHSPAPGAPGAVQLQQGQDQRVPLRRVLAGLKEQVRAAWWRDLLLAKGAGALPAPLALRVTVVALLRCMYCKNTIYGKHLSGFYVVPGPASAEMEHTTTQHAAADGAFLWFDDGAPWRPCLPCAHDMLRRPQRKPRRTPPSPACRLRSKRSPTFAPARSTPWNQAWTGCRRSSEERL